MSRTLALAFPIAILAVLTACDSDGDGLSNHDEASAGTDPEVPDTDGDGVLDSDEVHMGADPLNADSDADGYPDGLEVEHGSNPLDPDDGLYKGGWPYNPDKDSIVDPGWEGHAEIGATLPRFKWVDQHDEEVDIYDFAGHGKPVIIDVSEYRCYWCQEAAGMLEGEPSAFDSYGYAEMKEKVDNGDVYWVTLLDGDYYTGADIDEDIRDHWMALFPNENVPVLMDEDRQMAAWMQLRGYPDMLLVEDDMVVSVHGDIYTDVWDEILSR